MSSDEVSEPDIWKWEHLTQDLVREAIMRDRREIFSAGPVLAVTNVATDTYLATKGTMLRN